MGLLGLLRPSLCGEVAWGMRLRPGDARCTRLGLALGILERTGGRPPRPLHWGRPLSEAGRALSSSLVESVRRARRLPMLLLLPWLPTLTDAGFCAHCIGKGVRLSF